jgi:hypothetical protein
MQSKNGIGLAVGKAVLNSCLSSKEEDTSLQRNLGHDQHIMTRNNIDSVAAGQSALGCIIEY